MQPVEVDGSLPAAGKVIVAVEIGLEASCADDTSEVYKMLMVRMWCEATGENPNGRV